MEVVSCDFCGRSDAIPVFVLRDLKLGLPGEFHLVRCAGCGLLYLNPRPGWGELQQYYEHYPAHVFANPGIPWVTDYGIIRRCNLIHRYQRYGWLLDVGCGTGAFLKVMEKYGKWELYGVEPASAAVRVARDEFHLRVFQGTLVEGNFPEDFFNVVTWWDVIEHVPDPSACLAETFRILQPGGWVFIQTPDPNSWEARLFGPYWIGFDAPRHLYMFPRAVLIRRLRETGFTVIRASGFAGNISTVCKSLGHWLRFQHREQLGNLLLTIADSGAIRAVTAPLYFLLRRLDLTFSVLYIAQKPNHR